jgi:hypothetical protein
MKYEILQRVHYQEEITEYVFCINTQYGIKLQEHRQYKTREEWSEALWLLYVRYHLL